MANEIDGIAGYGRGAAIARPQGQKVAPINVPIKVAVEPDRQPRGHRPRIPTLEALKKLIVNGLLMLPERYRPGMFLDIYV